MIPQDLEICREVHAGMTSKERNNINYLFLEPVDFVHFAEYITVVKRPMDLRTLKENLEKGTYNTRDEFYIDAKLIFDNAVLFNKDRDSAFVVKLAESMTKALERLRRNAEKKAARLGLAPASGCGEGGVKSSGGVGGGKSGDDASVLSDAVTVNSKGGGGSLGSSETKKTKKISIKLNRQKSVPSSSSANSTDGGGGDAVVLASSSKPAKKAKLKLKLTSQKGDTTARTDKFESTPMSVTRRAQCSKVLASLKRRQQEACKWFHKPVSDPVIVKDYREKISSPMDLSSMSSKLDKDQYSTIGDFVNDLRLIAANCLQYNTIVDDSFRPIAVSFLSTAEELVKFFVARPELPKVTYPSLMYSWKECISVIDELVNTINPENGLQTIWFFLFPVTYFCGGEYPEGYLSKVKRPIDFGTIIQNLLVAGKYTTVAAFAADCRRVVENCRTYYAGNEEGESLCEQANRLMISMDKKLGPMLAKEKSGALAKEWDKENITIKRPEKDFLRNIMRELREATYTDSVVKITEKATLHFEHPVDVTIYTDYLKFVESPMDLLTVDRKIESGAYATPEDFEYDITLIFKNCDRYNGPKKNIHMINLGRHTAKIFRKLLSEKLRGGGSGGGAKRPSLPTATRGNNIAVPLTGKFGGKKRPHSDTPIPDAPSSKRVSIKGPSKMASKSAPSSKKLVKKYEPPRSLLRRTIALSSAPIPMHVAIASIKESYPGRRQGKDLEGWEAECLKLLRHLLKHPWCSAERPKYIFHVPVHFVFPEIRDEYSSKVKHPMDLTTAEAKLLQGVYQYADDFISDIALIFSNAITFNREGHELGEPMSCAYHEASTHLLKYIRWLSLDILQPCFTEYSDGPIVESGSAPSWKLSTRNRDLARKEMEAIVYQELIDTTDPGDRYSWTEQECDKLLKSLRHMSDAKHMGYFIQMNFPADYTAFISKPIAWDYCKDKLHERRYSTIGAIVSDLRLIFSNALKYNEGARHLSVVSGMAYDSAIIMSGKLEAAIDKMLLTVSDRVGRERIDMITSHREFEATQRAEEERRKLEWERENPGSTTQTKLRIVNKRAFRRRTTDFDFSFYDEEDNQHAESMQHLKAQFENQRVVRAKMQEIALSIGNHVFNRMRERAAANAMTEERIRVDQLRVEAEMESILGGEVTTSTSKGAGVAEIIGDDKRELIKLSLQHYLSMKKLKRKSTLISF